MQCLQAYKYELMPDGQQRRLMSRFAGSCRFVYNKALALQKERYEAGEKKHGYAALCKLLTQWRGSTQTPWLSDAPTHPLQQSLKDLERAYGNFFAKRADFPRFKRKGVRDSFRYPDAKQIKLDEANSRLFLPKLGWLRYRKSRDIQGKLCNATVSLRAGKWFVSIQTEREVDKSLPEATSAIGIDVGIARFATFSDGSYLAPLNSFKRHETALRKAQQSLNRKEKFSSNWRKVKRKVQHLHARIGNTRHDYLHKATSAISQNHAMVCIEDLQVRNMSKSAASTSEAPGRNIRAKSGLNKVILDQGWFEFRRQLHYKLDWNGGMLIVVPPQNTSRTCPACGHVSKDNRQTQADFVCVECGYVNNADVVGAINILRAGHARLACEVNRNGDQQQNRAQRHSEQRELQPTEVIQPSGNVSLDTVGTPCLEQGVTHEVRPVRAVDRIVHCNPPSLGGEGCQNLWEHGTIKPMVNQILVHISNTPFELIDYCQSKNILVQAYSPFGHGEILKNPRLIRMAEKYGVTVAQLSIRYCLQLGTLPLPKTTRTAYMRNNADINFEITAADMTALRNIEPIKSYGEADIFPVYGGKLEADGTLRKRERQP